MVKTAAIITGFKCVAPLDLVINACHVLMLAIRLHARRYRLPRAQVHVFDERDTRFGIGQRRRNLAATEVRSRVCRPTGAGAAALEDHVEIREAETATAIRTERIAAPLVRLRAPRRLGQQQLHYVVDHAVAAEDLHPAGAGRVPCHAEPRRYLVAPRKIDGLDIESLRSGQAFLLEANAQIQRYSLADLPRVLHIERVIPVAGGRGQHRREVLHFQKTVLSRAGTPDARKSVTVGNTRRGEWVIALSCTRIEKSEGYIA